MTDKLRFTSLLIIALSLFGCSKADHLNMYRMVDRNEPTLVRLIDSHGPIVQTCDGHTYYNVKWSDIAPTFDRCRE